LDTDLFPQEGLVNVCNVKKITNIKPLLFVHRNQGEEHENSLVVGSKKCKEVETTWSFTLKNGA
jgi:hypothetical protein